jgi:hypothetical protein
VNYYFYDVADIDCNKAVDGVDVLRVLNDLAGIPNTPAPQFCFPGNPDGLSGYNIADALFIRREIANLNP